jgi:hypothetical protein
VSHIARHSLAAPLIAETGAGHNRLHSGLLPMVLGLLTILSDLLHLCIVLSSSSHFVYRGYAPYFYIPLLSKKSLNKPRATFRNMSFEIS